MHSGLWQLFPHPGGSGSGIDFPKGRNNFYFFFLPKLKAKVCLAPFSLGFPAQGILFLGLRRLERKIKMEGVEKEIELLFQREGKEGILGSLELGKGEIPAGAKLFPKGLKICLSHSWFEVEATQSEVEFWE